MSGRRPQQRGRPKGVCQRASRRCPGAAVARITSRATTRSLKADGRGSNDRLPAVPPPFHRRPRRVLGRTGPARALEQARRADLRLFQAAVRQVVQGRRDQPVLQRRRSPRRRAPERPRAGVHLDRDRRGEGLFLRRAAARGRAHGGDLPGARRQARRPRADLHADDRRGGVRDARLRAHRRDPLGGVRRLRGRLARHPHRRRQAGADGQLGRRHAQRQAGALQAPGGRSLQARRIPARQGADHRPRPRQGLPAGRRP